jgi:hypothetical protein
MGQQRSSSWNSQSKSLVFFIGKDSHGNWVVQDQHRLSGGLFVDRAEALRFARFENGHRHETVVMVSGILELDMSGKAIIEHPLAIAADPAPERRVGR